MSEAFVLVQYKAPLIPPGAACEACGKTGQLTRDHCHGHGWVRGIVCMSCNKYLESIDRRVAPKIGAALLTALLALQHRCPDCTPLDVSDLRSLAYVPRGQQRRAVAEIVAQLGVSIEQAEEMTRQLEGKNRENQARRAAQRQGLRLTRARVRDPSARDYGWHTTQGRRQLALPGLHRRRGLDRRPGRARRAGCRAGTTEGRLITVSFVEDRWHVTGADGKQARTARFGTGRRWRCRYFDPDGRERSKSFERKADAERFEIQVSAAVLLGTYMDPDVGRVTLRKYAAEWLAAQAHDTVTAPGGAVDAGPAQGHASRTSGAVSGHRPGRV